MPPPICYVLKAGEEELVVEFLLVNVGMWECSVEWEDRREDKEKTQLSNYAKIRIVGRKGNSC